MKVSVVFKGNNYLVWSRMARNVVGSKCLLKHITSGVAPKALMLEKGKEGEEDELVRRWISGSKKIVWCSQLFMRPWSQH